MAKRVTTKRERVLERALAIEREIADESNRQRRDAQQQNAKLASQLETARQLNDTFREEFNRVCKERDLAIQDSNDAARDRDAWKAKAENQKARAEHFRLQRECLLDLMMVASEKLPWEQGS